MPGYITEENIGPNVTKKLLEIGKFKVPIYIKR